MQIKVGDMMKAQITTTIDATAENINEHQIVECPFCHEGSMREDSCGCLTCRKCHRVEGTNCNIAGCQNARFSTCT